MKYNPVWVIDNKISVLLIGHCCYDRTSVCRGMVKGKQIYFRTGQNGSKNQGFPFLPDAVNFIVA